MRITGGDHCGYRLKVPRGQHVRPTQDRVREALFSILGASVAAGGFLDLYAGSGAVGLDAWSRGAEPVCWVEQDRRVRPVIQENVQTITGETRGIFLMAVRTFLKKGLVNTSFATIFADPPYQKKRPRGDFGGGDASQQVLLDLVAGSRLLASGGTVVIEQAAAVADEGHRGWDLLDERVYGVARLRFFRAVAL